MDLLKMHKRRSRLSEAAYLGLNIGMALTLLLLVRSVEAPWLAFMVVLLSKWRALAVRPRFWFANLVANMVDIIVGLSVVVLLYSADGQFWLQALITGIYIIWLLIIKPRSKRSVVALQAGIAAFVGITALSIMSASWDALLFVAVMWVMGFVCTRHILGAYEEPLTPEYSLIGGFVASELGWIGYHWLLAYPLFGLGSIKFSQLAIYGMLFGLVAERSYASYHKNGFVKRADVIMPILFTVSVMLAMYILSVINGNKALT